MVGRAAGDVPQMLIEEMLPDTEAIPMDMRETCTAFCCHRSPAWAVIL